MTRTSLLRGFAVAWVVLVPLQSGAEDAAPALPVTVAVTATNAYLRSGPGDDFYPTERLAPDALVEVWAVDASGYCAVRPVAGSFTWLRATDVAAEAGGDLRPDAQAVVVTDGAVARVGSQLNDLRHVSQVALEAGERVRVAEVVRIPEGRHAGAWVRIDPPAGEFRWARGEDLALPVEFGLVADMPRAPPEAGLAAAGGALAAIRDASVAVTQAVAEVDEPAAAAVDATAPGLLPGLPAATRIFTGWLPRGTNVFDTAPPTPPAAVAAGAVAAPADELADIDLALSLAVAGPSESWNLAPLRERLRLAATRATSESERTRAHALDARLARFETIQGQQRTLAAATPADPGPLRLGGMWSSLSALGSRPVRPGVLPGGAPAAGRPDWTPPDVVETTGRLATVVSRRPDAPRWALVDEHNNVLAFVTPQTGLNLAPLVGQQVSVRGAKGYMPEYKRPYVVAAEARTRLADVPPSAGTAPDRTQ